MSEQIPTIYDLNAEVDDDDEVTVFIEMDDPTEEELLRFYRSYRRSGGDAYEPYESMMRAEDEAAA